MPYLSTSSDNFSFTSHYKIIKEKKEFYKLAKKTYKLCLNIFFYKLAKNAF